MKLNKIKKHLKDESKSFIPDIKNDLFKTLGIEKPIKPHFKFKQYVLVISTILILAVGIYFFITRQINEFPNTLITVDINPSIEIEADDQDRVVSVIPLNLDALLLLEDTGNLTKQDIYIAMDIIIEEASKAGYLDINTGEVRINVINERQIIEDRIKENIKKHYKNNQRVEVAEYNEEIRKKAKEYNISVGKMRLIEKLIELDPSISIKEAKKLSIKEINKRIRSYNQEDITESKVEYNQKVKEFSDAKDAAYNNYLNNYEVAERELEEINEFIKNKKNHLARNKINSFSMKYMNGYELDFEDSDELLEDLIEELEEQKEFIEELIEFKYETQLEFLHDVIKDGTNEDIFNFVFDNDFSFVNILGNIYYNDDEKDLILLIYKVNLLIDNTKNNLGIIKEIDELMEEIDELMEEIDEVIAEDDIREELKTNDTLKNIKDKYNDLYGNKGKK